MPLFISFGTSFVHVATTRCLLALVNERVSLLVITEGGTYLLKTFDDWSCGLIELAKLTYFATNGVEEARKVVAIGSHPVTFDMLKTTEFLQGTGKYIAYPEGVRVEMSSLTPTPPPPESIPPPPATEENVD